jgi:GntR family transcriptional regulator, transcriptional repressor for pyruvate dehydrogenase complex
VRHGVGTFVKSDASRLVFINPDRVQPNRARLTWLVDARQLIEPTLAGRAAMRHTEEDLAALRRLLETAAELRADRAHVGPINLQFHARIAVAAGNVVLSDMLSAILELHTEDQLIIDRLFADPDRDHAEHLEILDAIVRRDAGAASTLMSNHLAEVLASVESSDVGTGERSIE